MNTLALPCMLALAAALIKWCVESYFNVAAFVVTGCAMVIALLIWLKARQNINKFIPILVFAGVVSLEFVLYNVNIIVQVAVTVALFLYILSRNLNDKYVKQGLFVWLVFRVSMMVFTQELSHVVLWRCAQIALFVAIFAHETFRVVSNLSIFVIVLIMYSQNDVIPHKIPIFLIMLPLMYVAVHAIEEMRLPKAIQYFVVVLIVTCAVYPHHNLETDKTNTCALVQNTEQCLDMPFQTQITQKCCCKKGYVKMPKRTACVKQTCLSNLNRDPQKDCCKITRNYETESFLAGEYMCLCNNQPGQEIQNIFNAASRRCVCNNGLKGKLCTITDTAS